MRSIVLHLLALVVVLSAACAGPRPQSAPERTASTSQALTTISWSGYTWDIKAGTGLGPGPNNWDDSTNSVWIDGTGSLNLKVRKSGSKWYCAEVWLPTALGHGTYEFFIKTRTDTIDKNLVNAFFLYQDDTHEMDVEWSKWGNGSNANNGDFAIQPSTFQYWHQDIASGDWQKDRIIWTTTDGGADQVEFQVETNSVVVQDWTQSLPAAIDPSLALVHINNWMFQGHAPSNNQSETLTLVSFTFTPQ
jgi:hypothetical protein